LSKYYLKTIPYTLLITTYKNQDEAFDTYTFLELLWLEVVPFGTQVILQTLSFLIGHA
jgi:hypothetical protein